MTGEQVDRTLWVGNLDPRVSEELLYELFVQAGPLLDVKIAKDKDGNRRNYAFVEYKHDVSIPYTIQLMNGIRLFDRQLNLQFRPGSKHMAAANTMGRNSPLPGHEGRNSRPQTPNDAFDQGMDSPHFHRSRSMPANLSSFGDQRRMHSQMPHTPHRPHDQYMHEHSYRQEDFGYDQQEYGRHHDYSRYEQDYGRHPQDYNRHPQDYQDYRQISRNPLPMMPRYRSPNMPPNPWQSSGHRGHYGYS